MKKPEDFGITKYNKEKFEKTGILDCFQSVNLRDRKLETIPFQFGIVNGYFDCANNQLGSLEGCPFKVGSFNCSHNQLKSLKGAPKTTARILHCHGNPLDMTVQEWIKNLEKYQNGDLYKSCRIVPDNSSYESTLKGLKEKRKILKALK